MAQNRIRYLIDVYAKGVQATTGTVDFSLRTSQLADAPTVGGQLVRAAEGRVESQPWTLRVLDVNSTFTSHLASSTGRLQLLGRLTRIRASLDSTASSNYKSLTVGRVSDITLDQNVNVWDVTIQDERFLERDTQIFAQANTCMLVPKGTIAAFQGNAPPTGAARQWQCTGFLGNLVELTYLSPLGGGGSFVGNVIRGIKGQATSISIAQLIIDDVKPGAISPNAAMTVGNFLSLRWHNDGNATDYELSGFGRFGVGGSIPDLQIVRYWQTLNETNPPPLRLWVVWPTSPPTLNQLLTGYLYAPSHLPTDTLPIHVGGNAGLHPMRVARNAYNGTYNPTGSTGIKLRISTAAFDRLEADPSYGLVWFRITSPIGMAQFLEDRIFGPYNVAATIDTSGRISPISLRLPTSTGLGTPAVISSTVAVSHPTWEHPSREAVTALRLRFENYAYNLDKDGKRVFADSGDGLQAGTKETTRLYDNVTALGRKEVAFQFGSLTWPPLPTMAGTLGIVKYVPLPQVAEQLADSVSQNLFARFGDGPLYANVSCLRSIDATTNGTLQPGKVVKLNVASWPNPKTNTRGGLRYMQIIQRTDSPVGPTFRLLDVGSTLAGLTAPSVAAALVTGDTRHALTLTISSVPAGARWEAQLAGTTSTGAAAPASSSPSWMPVGGNTTGTLTATLGHRASHTKYFARVRALKGTRFTSPWSTASVSVVTAKITGPSALSATAITAGNALLKWTNGSSLYPIGVMVDTSTAATLGSSRQVISVPAQTTRYLLHGTNAGSKHKVGVRHQDHWGGFSTMATATYTASTVFTTAPALRGLALLKPKL